MLKFSPLSCSAKLAMLAIFSGMLCTQWLASSSALAQDPLPSCTPDTSSSSGQRDTALVRWGYMSISSSGLLRTSDNLLGNWTVEYLRGYSPRIDLRIGTRVATNSKINRTQIQEFFIGPRYYLLGLGSDLSSSIAASNSNPPLTANSPNTSSSSFWMLAYRPYFEAQVSYGHYVGTVAGDPPVYNLAAQYYGLGLGGGIRTWLIRGLAIDAGMNYQIGISNDVVVLDPSILHVFAGIAVGI